jgi:hypothetical protein
LRYPGCRFKTSHNINLSIKYRKTHSNSCNFSRGNISVAVINLLITQPLFCPIFSHFHILYNNIRRFLRYFIQTLHFSWKYRKTHSKSCNFSRGNINFITIIRLYCVIRVAVINLLITHPLFCPIFSNFHILYNFICSFPWFFIQIMYLS